MKDGICGENKTKPNLFLKTNRGSTNLWVFVRLLKIRGCVYHTLPFQWEHGRFKSCRNILTLRNFFRWLQPLAQSWDSASCLQYVSAVAKDWFVPWTKEAPYLFFLSFNLFTFHRIFSNTKIKCTGLPPSSLPFGHPHRCHGAALQLNKLCSLLLLSDSHHGWESAFPTPPWATSLLNIWVKILSVRNGRLKHSASKAWSGSSSLCNRLYPFNLFFMNKEASFVLVTYLECFVVVSWSCWGRMGQVLQWCKLA